MSYCSLMTPFLNARSAEAAFDLSVVAARAFGAHIEATHLRQHPAMPATVYQPFPYAYVTVDIAEIEEAAAAAAAELRAAFESLCSKHGLASDAAPGASRPSASWREIKGEFPTGYALSARSADLCVLARRGEDTQRFEIDVLEELLFNSGRPVLIGDGTASSLTKTVIIAWDGGREAARAVGAAAPALKAAERVIVAAVGQCEEDVANAGADAAALAERLSRGGVAAEAHDVAIEDGEKPESRLLTFAQNQAAELMVMGAYSHSRFRELVLGGFTRRFLEESPIPLLIAH